MKWLDLPFLFLRVWASEWAAAAATVMVAMAMAIPMISTSTPLQ